MAKATVTKGFFGINMESTGKGKTLANAKIMYAIDKRILRRCKIHDKSHGSTEGISRNTTMQSNYKVDA